MTSFAGLQFFIAGIIQGSYRDTSVSPQDYRKVIKELLENNFSGSTVYCPVQNHPDSVKYSTEKAAQVFHGHIDIVKASDAVVVYLPEASMGSSIEMWEAWKHNIPVVTITPMAANWVVRILSAHVCAGLEEFASFTVSGGFAGLLKK